jgi:hypothetical protein
MGSGVSAADFLSLLKKAAGEARGADHRGFD